MPRPATMLFAAALSLVLVLGVSVVCIVPLERGTASEIESYSAAACWAITTMTTTGYGDLHPVTGVGRLLAAVLMLEGLCVFALLTASLVQMSSAPDDAEKEAELRRLRDLCERLERRLQQ